MRDSASMSYGRMVMKRHLFSIQLLPEQMLSIGIHLCQLAFEMLSVKSQTFCLGLNMTNETVKCEQAP